MSNKHFCTCCQTNTADFYINVTSGQRANFCNKCCEKYSLYERRQMERQYVLSILTGLNIEDVKELI